MLMFNVVVLTVLVLVGAGLGIWVLSLMTRPDGMTEFERDVSRTTQTGMRRKQSRS